MFKILCIFALWIVGSHDLTTRGTSIAPSTSFMIDVTKKIDIMARKKTLLEVKELFHEAWGDRFIYDFITEENYVNMTTKVPVVCREHGTFMITPQHHANDVGCRACQYKKLRATPIYANRKNVFDIGRWDVGYSCNANEYIRKASNTWRGMLGRCYDKEYLKRRPSYLGCMVCKEWLLFSNFKEWFDKYYVDGYSLDKDILKKGNRVYSPYTCCFVPQEINSLIVNNKKGRGQYPVGVRKGCGMNSYQAIISIKGTTTCLGTFYSIEDAFNSYKEAKEAHIKEIATEYYNGGKITERVYKALLNYKVEITD